MASGTGNTFAAAGLCACAGGTACTPVVTAAGAHVSACIPENECGATGGPGADDGGGSVGPPGGGIEGGAVSGSVGVNGGTVSRLFFSVVGDTRPPTEDDIAGYPTSIITGIFKDMSRCAQRRRRPDSEGTLSTGNVPY